MYYQFTTEMKACLKRSISANATKFLKTELINFEQQCYIYDIIMSHWCLGGAAVGHRTSDLAVMGLIPGPGVIRHLGQLSLPSIRGR